MVKILPSLLLLVGLASLSGCGETHRPLVTDPLTEEQKRQVREEDQRVNEEESSDYQPAKKGKKRR